MAKPLRIGMIGYGFMGRAHSNGYNRVKDFFDLEYLPVLQAVAARDADKAKAFADRWGYKRVETDWRKLVAADDIDAIDICTPNNLHAEIAIEAAKHGKAILCEKPLSMDAAEGEKMCQAVEKAGVPNMVWYNYRRIPAVTFAKQIIDSGKLGRVFHYRAEFLQDWTINADLPQGGAALWRLDAAAAGSGVTGDLLAHCIDTALWLNGSVTDVTAMTETFVKERKHQLTGKVEKVGDRRRLLVPLPLQERVARPLREHAVCPRPQGPLHVRDQRREHEPQVGSPRSPPAAGLRLQGRRADARLEEHPRDRRRPSLHGQVVGAGPGDRLRALFVHQVADFLEAYAKKQPAHPTFRDALETQKVCDAVLASAKSHQWVTV